MNSLSSLLLLWAVLQPYSISFCSSHYLSFPLISLLLPSGLYSSVCGLFFLFLYLLPLIHWPTGSDTLLSLLLFFPAVPPHHRNTHIPSQNNGQGTIPPGSTSAESSPAWPVSSRAHPASWCGSAHAPTQSLPLCFLLSVRTG